MSTLAEIEKAIEELPPDAFRELRDWFAERDWERWDKQIERDAGAGKFDSLRAKVRQNYDAGKCTEL